MNAREWVEQAEPRTLAHWPCDLDGSTELTGEVVRIGSNYITAHNGLTLESQLFPGCAILVVHKGRHEFIRWEPTRISRINRPANCGGAAAPPRDNGG